MEEEAHKMFRRADVEGKGFIVKKDMQRFKHEVSLSSDQLDAVFESLDACANGFLTLDQFLAGFNNLENDVGKNEHENDVCAELDDRTNNINCEYDKNLKNIINNEILISRSTSSLKKLNAIIAQNPPDIEIEEAWLQFIRDFSVDIQRLKEQIEELERVLAARDKRHEEEILRLFDEFETQLSEEREKLSNEIILKDRKYNLDLKEKLKSKDNQIADALNQRDEILERFYDLQAEENNVRLQNMNFIKTMDEQKTEIENQQNLISRLQDEVDLQKKNIDNLCKKNFEEGFMLANKIAILEEEGLLQQLKMIKKMQLTLQEGNIPERKNSQTESECVTTCS